MSKRIKLKVGVTGQVTLAKGGVYDLDDAFADDLLNAGHADLAAAHEPAIKVAVPKPQATPAAQAETEVPEKSADKKKGKGK